MCLMHSLTCSIAHCWQKHGQAALQDVIEINDDEKLVPMGKEVRIAIMKLDLEGAGEKSTHGELCCLMSFCSKLSNCSVR